MSTTSQQLKQLKDDLKPHKKDRKSLELEVNDAERLYKQLKTKHQKVLKNLESKCTYWTMADELLLKIKTKSNCINYSSAITINSNTLEVKNLEAVVKHLKVNTHIFYLFNQTITIKMTRFF